MERIERAWTAWRGRAVEPLIRRSLRRLLPDDNGIETEAVGGWWNRQNKPEIHLVGADREPVAAAVHFVGSITWLENQPFGRRDYDALVRDMLAVPGAAADTPLVAVSRSGMTDGLPWRRAGDRTTWYVPGNRDSASTGSGVTPWSQTVLSRTAASRPL